MLPPGTKVRFRSPTGFGRVWMIWSFEPSSGYYVLSADTMVYFAKPWEIEICGFTSLSSPFPS